MGRPVSGFLCRVSACERLVPLSGKVSLSSVWTCVNRVCIHMYPVPGTRGVFPLGVNLGTQCVCLVCFYRGRRAVWADLPACRRPLSGARSSVPRGWAAGASCERPARRGRA